MRTKKCFWTSFNEQLADLFFALKERWECEKEFEDINEYGKALENNGLLPKCGGKIIAMTKRPFGFKAQCLDGIIHVFIKTEGNTWKICAKSVEN